MTQKELNLQESIWNSMLIWAKLYAIIKDDSFLKSFQKSSFAKPFVMILGNLQSLG